MNQSFTPRAGALWAVALVPTFIGCTHTVSGSFRVTTEAQEKSEVTAIRSVVQRYETALNAGDVPTILSLYGKEPVFMPQHAAALVGRDAVRAGYEQVVRTLGLSIRFEAHEVEVLGDTAWARTSSAGRTRVLATDTERQEGNNELFIFQREGGEWKIHRYLFATNRAPH